MMAMTLATYSLWFTHTAVPLNFVDILPWKPDTFFMKPVTTLITLYHSSPLQLSAVAVHRYIHNSCAPSDPFTLERKRINALLFQTIK